MAPVTGSLLVLQPHQQPNQPRRAAHSRHEQPLTSPLGTNRTMRQASTTAVAKTSQAMPKATCGPNPSDLGADMLQNGRFCTAEEYSSGFPRSLSRVQRPAPHCLPSEVMVTARSPQRLLEPPIEGSRHDRAQLGPEQVQFRLEQTPQDVLRVLRLG